MWEGRLRFEARHPTARGASVERPLRPARFVAVALVDSAGRPLAEGRTDHEGRFRLPGAPSASALRVTAHAADEGLEVQVATDVAGQHVHTLGVALGPPGAPLEVTVGDETPEGFAGALHIADTMLRGLRTAKTWGGEALPPLTVRWGRGVTTNWSFYLGERPAHSGRFAIELLGGEPGRQGSTDTDEHDEAIMLHELGHYVFDRWTGNSSLGGGHPAAAMIDPGLAWEEGRATWFATTALGDDAYEDTIGLEPGGRLRIGYHLEDSPSGVHGNGSELSVSALLWDLSDGTPGLPDRDGDGVQLAPSVILQAMVSLGRSPGAYPCMAAFLRHLVDRGALPEDRVRALLRHGGEPSALLPRAGESAWPWDLMVPGRAGGKIDGVTNPAPSGGVPRPENGFDAVHVYRVHLPSRARFRARLTIEGTGRPEDRSDLDLELRDTHAETLASSRGRGPVETFTRELPPGWYLVYVRDGATTGDRANYTLTVSTVP
ncbi:MAG: hypothetical protein HY909_00050 [Deltaproteobacteria bacterium]|nr:hypothetical protein [Deltaproteobacteria bacterium]